MLLREPGEAPEDSVPTEEDAAEPAATPRPAAPTRGAPAAARRAADAPREGLWDPEEPFPEAPDRFRERLFSIEKPDRADDDRVLAYGREVRDAFLRIPDLHLRWQDERVRDRFLAARLTLPPDAGPHAGGMGPSGAPLAALVGILSGPEFSLVLRPPVVIVGAPGWSPE